jgi:hypothetical protein
MYVLQGNTNLHRFGSGENAIVVYGQFGYFIKLGHVNTTPF